MDARMFREGDVHEVASVGGHSFVIRYGYYSEADRHCTDPIPIYPCFIQDPKYTQKGQPLITRIQDACHHYSPEEDGDGWCADCRYAGEWNGQIGICRCEHRKQEAVY